ncbi:MAG: GFA family protein [Gammaproteobacteria bacterium]|nr:GFA family protein [Gammaproteobacteria bacterium]
MKYKGSCHCGQIAFEVEGELSQVADCNCSICSRLGSLHWFVPRDNLHLLTPESGMASYQFGPRTISHYFCPNCGIHPFGEGADPSGKRMAAVNARCLEDVDLSSLQVAHYDGRSL